MLKNILIILLFLGLNIAKAQIFEATGIGDTPEMAKKDAVANAIKFSVGEFMLNKEELTNEDLNQKIVSYSNAYVKRINIISQEKINHSEYKVNVEVDIESQKLIGALKEMQIAVIENAVDSDTLLEAINHFDKNDINKQNKQNFGELVEELLIKPIKEHKELIEVQTIGKLKPLQPKGNSNHFPLQLDLSISPTKEYIDAFKRILKEAKSDKSSGIPVYE